MLIQKFFVPADEVSDLGLQEINMSRLGRFVALAGKNGAGKSRILNKLEFYGSARVNGRGQLPIWREQLTNASCALTNNPTSPHRAAWEQSVESCRNQIVWAAERIIAEESTEFKAIRFVPKELTLQDPRNYASRELVSRFSQAKSIGLNGYEQHCLFYIQQLQSRWWNAGHQLFSGSSGEKAEALQEYEGFQTLIQRMLGTKVERNLNGEPTLFGKPIPDSGLSDGQKIILQLCVALHAQHSQLDNTVFLLDEPENHLHPSAVIDLLKSLYETTSSSQIWVATHSIPLLAYIASIEPTSLWYVNEGGVRNAGRHPEIVLDSLLGDEERIGQLNSFTSLPAQLAAINYATESLSAPKVVAGGENDPQISQIHQVISKLAEGRPLNILDFGAGKGRLLEGLAATSAEAGQDVSTVVDYYAFDAYPDDRDTCLCVIGAHFPDSSPRHFASREEFFSHKNDGCIDIVVMCNVLHEIPPKDWLDIFSDQSIVTRALNNNGYLLLVEDQRIPVGELAHEHGFIVLDTSHLRTLFSVCEQDHRNGLFVCNDARGDGRLKAHLISKKLLCNVTSESRKKSIDALKSTAKTEIKKLRNNGVARYSDGLLHGFWTQQFANTSLYLDEC